MHRVRYWSLLVVVGVTSAVIAFWLKGIVGLATDVTLVLILVPFCVLFFLYEISPRRKLDWRRLSPQLVDKSVLLEKLSSFEERLRRRWEAGEHTLDVMVCLSHVYLHLKRPQDAEWFAQQASAKEEAKGLVKYRDWQKGDLRDNAYLARAAARAFQGDFAQAARELDQYRQNHAFLWNHVTTYTAFLYLLADDETMVRAVTADIKPYTSQKLHLHLREPYQFLAAYLQQRFLDKDTSGTLNKLSRHMNAWFDAYRLCPDFEAYHTRMREIVADMADVVPMGWLQWANLRWSMNETEAMIAEMEDKRAHGDTSYQTAFVLASSKARLGYGQESEPLARAAFDAIQAEGWFERRDPIARYLTDAAYDALACALLMQGHFAESADCLMQVAPCASSQNLFLVLSAWGYYLAGDMEQSRTVINQMKPIKPTMERGLAPGFVLLHRYLRYRLGMDESPEALIHQPEYALNAWQEPLNRLVDNPYRRAVQTMVNDVRALIDAESQITNN